MAEPLNTKTFAELRESWQAKILRHTRARPIGMVVLSVLADYHDDVEELLWATFPGFSGLRPPGLCSAGKVDKDGSIVADLITRHGYKINDFHLFRDALELETAFRRLADQLKFTDAERVEMFVAVRGWVRADRRLDPTMNPADPDARRLVH